MRRLTAWSIVSLFLAALPASAQTVLPASAGGWAGTNDSPIKRARPPEPILAEYGVTYAQEVSYSRPPGRLDAIVYQLKDASGAYGLYSYLRGPDMRRANFTDHSSVSPSVALVLAGDLVLDVVGDDLAKEQPQIQDLANAVASHARLGPLPTLSQHLPQKNLVEGTDRYIVGPQAFNELFPGNLGDSIGFHSGAEAVLAHYRLNGHDATLVITDYPTPQITSQKLAELQQKFNVNRASPGNGSPMLFAGRSLTMLTIVSGASSPAEADALLNQVQYDPDLTWNEPTFQFKEPSIEMMIEGSIVGAITICVFALIAGLSFGGVRLIVKRVMPGKVFDRSSHLQVLQLGLGSKAINSDDFYGYSAPVATDAAVNKDLPDRIALRIFR